MSAKDGDQRMMTAFRAAYWLSDDGQGEVLLTARGHSGLARGDLLAIARAGLADAEIDIARDGGMVVVGDWQEGA